MKLSLKYSLLLGMCFPVVSAFAQIEFEEDDNKPKKDPLHLQAESFLRGDTLWTPYDSSFSEFQRYHFLAREGQFFQDLGESGTPAASKVFNGMQRAGFQTGFVAYNPLLFTTDNSKYYRSFLPFTSFYYTQGNKNYIQFNAFHTQNITERWNMAFRYRSVTNDGFYQNPSNRKQGNVLRNAQLTSNYVGKNDRYRMVFSLNWNRSKLEETGGNLNDSTFESLDGGVRLVQQKFLDARSLFHHREHNINQVYWLKMNRLMQTDSSFLPVYGFGLENALTARKTTRRFIDNYPDALFYPRYYFDTTATKDSFAASELESFVGFIWNTAKTTIRAGGGGSIIRTYTDSFFTSDYHNTFLYFTAKHQAEHHRLDVAAKYFLPGGFNGGDYLLNGSYRYKVGMESELYAEGVLQQYTNAYVMGRYVSNYGIWNQNNLQIQYNALTVGYKIASKRKWAFKGYVKQQILANYVFFDTSWLPTKASDNASVFSAGAVLALQAGKFRLVEEAVFQNASKQHYLRVPAIVSRTSFYYENAWFKKAIKVQIGVDIHYTSEYAAFSYMPHLGNFVLQDKRKQGHYPVVDFYVNGEVKTLRFFAKMEHLNQDLLSTTMFPNYYYETLNYPLPPMRFRLGLAWKFYY